MTLVAGIDHGKFKEVSAGIICNQIKGTMAQAGKTKFILAPVAPADFQLSTYYQCGP